LPVKPLARILLVLVAVAVAASLLPPAAGACPLCKDAKSDSDYAGGTASLPTGFYYSILLMVCAPFAVVGALATRIALARRRRRLAPPASDSQAAVAPLPAEYTGSRS
jgi:hypothetical protein